MSWARGKRGPSHAAAVCAVVASLQFCSTSSGDPVPVLEPPVPVRVDRLTTSQLERTAAVTSCTVSTECDDGQPCTADVCSSGVCFNIFIADCVPCTPQTVCPPIDIVFVMDTSGSMRDEAAALCVGIAQVIADLNQQGVAVNADFLGITQTLDGSFACLTDNVVNLLGGAVPGNASCCPFPDGTSAYESWGPATAIVAARFPWTPGATRIVVPISDEGPCNGSLPDGCNDPGDDRNSIDNAIAVALANSVVVSPITGTGSDACVISLATLAATGTGGKTLQSKNAKLDLAEGVREIILDRCSVDDRSDDQHACTLNDRCRDGVCVGTPVENCRSCLTSAQCDDEDQCTTDSCIEGVCSSTPNYDVSTQCCNPTDGTLTVVDDGDPCTADLCEAATGQVTHPPSPAGTVCDDQKGCTVMDQCDGLGRCQGTDVGSIPCASDADCLGLTCDIGTGLCICGDTPEVCLTAVPGNLPEPGCFAEDADLFVDITLSSSSRIIVGGQFLVVYDPAVLDFIDVEPGAFVDPESPFGSELIRTVNEVEGTVFEAVGIFLGTSGTHGPALMARLRFRPLQACSITHLCFASRNPADTLLTDNHGHRVPFTSCCTDDLVIHGEAPVLECPGDTSVNADPGRLSATVTWPPTTARGSCDGDLAVYCTGSNSFGADVSHLVSTGGRLPAGTSDFECMATDSCGVTATCDWTVDVRNANAVQVDLQLSPVVAAGPLRRCIVFEFFSNCVEAPVVVEQTIEFGLPFNLAGHADDITLTVPAGQYACVTARDPKHTLRSVSTPQVSGGTYLVRFTGDPRLGGNWLVGGNLDGNNVIDSLDQALLNARLPTTVSPDTPCGTGGIHADINGDGVVNSNDLNFIQRNFLATDKVCCGTASGGAATSEPSVISVADLDALGLSDLRDADADHDGFLTAEEIMAFLQGGWPTEDPPPAAPDDPAP